MLALLVMIGATPANEQPIIHNPAFRCTPTWIRTSTGIIGCMEGVEVSLWGIIFSKPSKLGFPTPYFHNRLVSSFRAKEVRVAPQGYLHVIGAPEMDCYSSGSGKRRVAQCFVKGRGAFGGIDLACTLMRSNITRPKQFARPTYVMCITRMPTREEIENVIKNGA